MANTQRCQTHVGRLSQISRLLDPRSPALSSAAEKLGQCKPGFTVTNKDQIHWIIILQVQFVNLTNFQVNSISVGSENQVCVLTKYRTKHQCLSFITYPRKRTQTASFLRSTEMSIWLCTSPPAARLAHTEHWRTACISQINEFRCTYRLCSNLLNYFSNCRFSFLWNFKVSALHSLLPCLCRMKEAVLFSARKLGVCSVSDNCCILWVFVRPQHPLMT